MKEVTGEDVKQAVLAAGLVSIPLRECSMCGVEISYLVEGGVLFFDSSCGCEQAPPKRVKWEALANLINRQTEEKHRLSLMAKFGLGEDDE